jgi:hypothetical protein
MGSICAILRNSAQIDDINLLVLPPHTLHVLQRLYRTEEGAVSCCRTEVG